MQDSKELEIKPQQETQNFLSLSDKEQKKLISQLFTEHQQTLHIAKRYRENPLYSPYAGGKVFIKSERLEAYFEVQEKLPIDYRLPNVLICLADYNNSNAKYSDLLGINTSVRLELPIYTDLPTMENYRKYVQTSEDWSTWPLKTFYFYNQEGDFKKIQQTNIAFDFDKPELYQTEGDPHSTSIPGVHGFESEITQGDYELAVRAVKISKDAFTALLKSVEHSLSPSDSSTKELE